MAAAEFADLVGALAEAMGQRPDSVRSTPDGLLLHTSDGFLFAFLENPSEVSLASIQRLLAEPVARSGRLVLLTPGRLPLALSHEAQRGRASLVEHERFRELLRGLDLETRIGEEPRGPHDVPGNRLLPSARHLDAVVARARTWLEWGVPALALRFYRQALAEKPEFGPARVGVGRCLAALGLTDEALAAFREVLTVHPGDVEARLGEASVHATLGHLDEEIRILRELAEERTDRPDIRAHLIAAELEAQQWPEAKANLQSMLAKTPEDPRLRFLHAMTLRHLGRSSEADAELRRARSLGLSPEQERSMSGHLGVSPPEHPTPAPPAEVEPSPPAAPPAPAPVVRRATRKAPAPARPKRPEPSRKARISPARRARPVRKSK